MYEILRALYDGEIQPAEQHRPMIDEYTAVYKSNYEHYAKFVEKLGSPLDREFMRIMDEQMDAVPLELTQVFVDGFRLGAKMMIDILDNHYQG